MAASEPWVRDWRVQWKGPWRVLDECGYLGPQHNTETASLKGCKCPRSLAIHPEALRKRAEINLASWKRNRTRILNERRGTKHRSEASLIKVNSSPIPDMRNAACGTIANRRTHENALAYPRTQRYIERAKEICAGCTIISQCESWVLKAEIDPGSWGGVFGGLSAQDRERARSAV